MEVRKAESHYMVNTIEVQLLLWLLRKIQG
jgi:hypothetical protein